MCRSISRFILTSAGLLACFWSVWFSGRCGMAELLSYYGSVSTSLPAVDKAVALTPDNPLVHRDRALVLLQSGHLHEAKLEFERAIERQPRNYYLWLELGRARDQTNDQGALTAFQEAVRLAPYYAEPHWQLGNLMLRLGQRDEGFAEMRQAAEIDVALFPSLVDLAWGAYGGNDSLVAKIVNPRIDSSRTVLARYFAIKGRPSAAIALFRAAHTVPETERRGLLSDFLAAKQFAEAHEVWAGKSRVQPDPTGAAITDAGFESQISFDELGFGWHLPSSLQGVRIAVDSANPHSGTRSLEIQLDGNVTPAAAIVSQLTLVAPNSQYRLHFAARTRELITESPLLIMVTDAGGRDARELGHSESFTKTSDGWQDYSLDFATGQDTTAVVVALLRRDCQVSHCPVYGRIWLDDFSIEKLPGAIIAADQ